jgi:hypothetical protein
MCASCIDQFNEKETLKLQTIEYQRSAVVLEYAPSIKTDQVSDEGNTVMDLAGLGKGPILLENIADSIYIHGAQKTLRDTE